MTLRLRFWLLAMDVADELWRASHRLYLFTVSKAGEATDWGEP